MGLPQQRCESGPRRGAANADTTPKLGLRQEASQCHPTTGNPDLTIAGVPVVQAEEVARDRRRKYPATIVRVCPKCRASHMHRGYGLREPVCGAVYLVVAP